MQSLDNYWNSKSRIEKGHRDIYQIRTKELNWPLHLAIEVNTTRFLIQARCLLKKLTKCSSTFICIKLVLHQYWNNHLHPTMYQFHQWYLFSLAKNSVMDCPSRHKSTQHMARKLPSAVLFTGEIHLSNSSCKNFHAHQSLMH